MPSVAPMRVCRSVHPLAQMGEQHHYRSPLAAGGVHLPLHAGGEFLLTEGVGPVAEVVLEVYGRRSRHRSGSGNPHKSHGEVAVATHLVAVEQLFAAGYVDKIAAQRMRVELAQSVHQVGHPEVELMVADGHIVVTHGVHQSDDIAAMGDGPHHRPREEVARGDNADVGSLGGNPVAQTCDDRIAVDGAMRVRLIEDDDVVVVDNRLRVFLAGCEAKYCNPE